MKILDIAIKDMTHAFRSYFALAFMFGVPLLMGGMFYLMFGSQASDGGFSVPVTKVAVANLDRGGPGFESVLAQFPSGTDAQSLGDLVLTGLQDGRFADLLAVRVVGSADAARSAVDSQQAGVALIIPADFSERFADLSAQAAVELYSDPTLTLGPAVVQSVLAQFLDGISGAKIAVNVAVGRTGNSNPAAAGSIVQQYLAGIPSGGAESLIETRAPASVEAPANPVAAIVGLIMAGMSVFYAFFTGASTAQSILKEDEDGTLARLFTTPTRLSAILGGKYLSVGITVAVQMAVLLLVSSLIFGIRWGDPLPLALVWLGTVAAAAGFGIALMSVLKNARQGSIVIGTVLTVTGMLGMARVFTMGSASAGALDTLSLAVPQGWAVRGLTQVMDGTGAAGVLPTLAVLLGIGAVLFVFGVLRFQKRYAQEER
jgi:ABC-2 type transport system permease protein